MMIPLLDLKREYALVRCDIEAAWSSTLKTMHLLKGENVAAFEREVAAYLEVAHVVGVASGTDALILSILGLGIGKGDEVIVHANAFVAALEAIHHAGASPVIVDTEPDGFGPDADAIARAITRRTKAVIAVHLYGSPLDLDELQHLCDAHGLALIEDASHAHGARRNGRRVGSLGRAGCFSCGVVKNLAACGDAGFVATVDADLAQRLRLLQAHGQEKKNQHVLYGFNSRLDELQAAVLRVKLPHLEGRNQRRRDIAAFYRERFAGLDLRTPVERPREVHVYHQ
ncbi:MAG: DegT/DnrJ/EryC1/StrS family aminotransferase, partial [Deltaproteobacteria bacterium]|nr:DegT/DnrJ/EryC1/StrS family aminotransferase [Deltaproteobacteria bacterium]